jgi:hypothetical protein
MRTSHSPRTRTFIIAGVIAMAAVGISACGSSGSSTTTSLTPAAAVLDAQYAKSIGFPKTVQAAKTSKTTQEKGCSNTVESVFENTADKTGLVSDVLECKTTASAATALAAVKKQITVDPSLTPPSGLGSSAFATATNAPEYLMVWQSGTWVAITAFDVDVTATSSSPSTATPLTAAQVRTLGQAALHQDSLYH